MVEAVNGKWLPVEGVKFVFDPSGHVRIQLTDNLYDQRILDRFLEPNNGNKVEVKNSLAL